MGGGGGVKLTLPTNVRLTGTQTAGGPFSPKSATAEAAEATAEAAEAGPEASEAATEASGGSPVTFGRSHFFSAQTVKFTRGL